MALTTWLPERNYNTTKTTATQTVTPDMNNAHVELTSSQWNPSTNGVTFNLYWSNDNGQSWNIWESFSCLQGDLTSKGFMPQMTVSRRAEMGTGTLLAYCEIIPLGSIRVGILGDILN